MSSGGEGDYDVRKKQADKFIKNGNRVKLSIQFRGREQQHMAPAATISALLMGGGRREHLEDEDGEKGAVDHNPPCAECE